MTIDVSSSPQRYHPHLRIVGKKLKPTSQVPTGEKSRTGVLHSMICFIQWLNFFSISSTELAGVSALYDRAALVALPPALRQRYVAHLGSILARHTVGLLVALERTLNLDAGPPFSVSEQDVHALYEPAFSVLRLASYEPDERGLRESVYRLECPGVASRT